MYHLKQGETKSKQFKNILNQNFNHNTYMLLRTNQPIPSDSKDKDTAAMLVVRTIEANEKYFVIDQQHGGRDVTCNPK